MFKFLEMDGINARLSPMAKNPRFLLIFIFFLAGFSYPVAAQDSVPLEGVQWNLVKLKGYKKKIPTEPSPVHFILDPAKQSVSGFGGCNRFRGTYTHQGPSLKFQSLASTRKFCAFGMTLEKELMQALEKTDSYKITAKGLELLQAGKKMAKFKAE